MSGPGNTIGEVIKATKSTSYISDMLKSIQEDKAMSDRSKAELLASTKVLDLKSDGLPPTKISQENNKTLQDLSKKYTDARESIASGTGGEFSRVLREKYLQSASSNPGRRQTIMTGRQ